ncbi:MAG: AAA family ATPase, partial [bacterium]
MDKGAHFYRCDFQVHTPRDLRWTGPACVTDEERNDYAATLIQACREKHLDAVAITDHHDLAFVKYIREAARTEHDDNGKPVPYEKQIKIFPGIELTLNVPCQALLIFDADFPEDLFSLALTALAITTNSKSDPNTAETKRLDNITTLVGLRDELDKHEYLKGRYIILPNVSEGGSDTLLRSGNAPKYKNMPCVGGYLDGSIKQLGTGNLDIINGKAREYGNKKIALFQTSDSRRDDHAELANHATWVKWATPTAEALRQGCLAQESRISQNEPVLPETVITSISVSNSAFLGPIDLELNQQYTALIGGRGTGKSTVLEYLRWALCDQQPDPAVDDELPNYQARWKLLIDHTLKKLKATVQVRFVVNGIPHLVRRNSDTREILLKIGDSDLKPCKEADIRSLLPIQAYSQKQLSNVGVRVDELTRFIHAQIKNELDDIDKRITSISTEIRQLYAAIQRKRTIDKGIEKEKLTVESLSKQATLIRESLSGVSED